MEGGIDIQEVIVQRKMIIERGNIDICEEMIGTKNSKIYTRDHTAFYSIEKMTDCDISECHANTTHGIWLAINEFRVFRNWN